MTIKSEPTRGLIHRGDTLLACSIGIEQTGPMQLTVRAGSFTMTGQARIIDAAGVPGLQALIEARRAEILPDGQRARIWLQDAGGAVLHSETYVLGEDAVFDLASDPTEAKHYHAVLGDSGGQPEVLMRSRFEGDEYPAWPAGWKPRQELIFEFAVPAGCADLADIDIYVLTVLPGFPPGTGPADWQTQAGGA